MKNTEMDFWVRQKLKAMINKEQILAEELRDRIAMAALTGLLANANNGWASPENNEAEEVARAAYLYVDAMIAEKLRRLVTPAE